MVAIVDRKLKASLDSLISVMDALHIPAGLKDSAPIQRTPGFEDLNNVTQYKLLKKDVIPLIQYGPSIEAGHGPGVALYGVPVSRFWQLERDPMTMKFVADLIHDRGKLAFCEFYDYIKTVPCMREMIKHNHVSLDNIPTEYGPIIASAIELHHTHQHCFSAPYPKTPRLPQTPESFVLSQLMAIQDCLHALITRPDKTTGKIHDLREATDLHLKEYSEMRIVYNGKMFPGINTRGEEILYVILREAA